MRKKIIIYFLSLAIAVGIFFAVRGILFPSGPTRMHDIHPLGVASGSGMVNLVAETRDSHGNLEYVLRCRQAVPVGNGRYKLTLPQMQFYTTNGQIVLITSQTGDVAVDQIGGALSSKIYPRKGSLVGHPTITIGPRASFKPGVTARQPGQIQMRLSRAIKFNYQEGLLTSGGSVDIRGDRLRFNGRKLTAEINVRKKTLEYLRISQGKRLIIRNALGGGARAPATSPSGGLTAKGSNKSEHSPHTGSQIPASPVYKLTFGKSVLVSLGVRTLAAHRLMLLFTPGRGSPSPTTGNANGTGHAAASGANHGNSGQTPAPEKKKANPNDLIVDWIGPLTVRPDINVSQIKNVSAHNSILVAYGRAGKPVHLHDGPQRTGTASRVMYQTGPQLLTMLSGGLHPLTFTDASIGSLTCRRLLFNNLTHQLLLTGPGRFAVQPDARTSGAAATATAGLGGRSGHWKGRWLNQLKVLISPGNKAGEKMAVRRIEVQGDVVIHNRALRIEGQKITAKLRRPAPRPGHAPAGGPQLSYFSAIGKVLVQSRSVFGTSPDQITCGQLQLFTHPDASTGRRVPALFQADERIHLLFHAQNKAGGKGSVVYKLAAKHLTANLEPAPAGLRNGTGRSQTSGRYQITLFHAWHAVRLAISGMGRPISVTAASLRGNRQLGVASLSAGKAAGGTAIAVSSWPKIQQGRDSLSAPHILLRRGNQSLTVPGPGIMNLAGKPAKSGGAADHVQVRWAGKMDYDGQKYTAAFSTRVRVTLRGEPLRHSSLSCPQLRVRFYKRPRRAGLHMAWLEARGANKEPVIARESSYSAAGLLRTRLYLNAGMLTYNAVEKVLRIPSAGRMVLEDYRKAGGGKHTPSQRGQSAFAWRQALSYHAKTGILSMRRHVRLVFRPMTPLKNPLSVKSTAAPASTSNGNAGLVLLDCHELMATLSQTHTTGARGSELGLGGPVRLSLVRAQRSALELMGIRLVADVLSMNIRTQIAQAYGLNGHDAVVTGQQGKASAAARKIVWNLSRGRQGLTLINSRGLGQTP